MTKAGRGSEIQDTLSLRSVYLLFVPSFLFRFQVQLIQYYSPVPTNTYILQIIFKRALLMSQMKCMAEEARKKFISIPSGTPSEYDFKRYYKKVSAFVLSFSNNPRSE